MGTLFAMSAEIPPVVKVWSSRIITFSFSWLRVGSKPCANCKHIALLDGWMIGIAGTQRRCRISIERCSAHPKQGIYEKKEIGVCEQPKRNHEMDGHGLVACRDSK